MQPSPIDVSADKVCLRKEALALRASLSKEERDAHNGRICEAILQSDAFGACRTLLCYYPVRGEIDLTPVAEQALALGKQVAFPISHTEPLTLTFHLVCSLQELTEGAYRIPEPDGTAPAITDFTDTLCLVPALAFDRDGFRLGYGKGYYDRFLADFCGVAVGAVYTACLCDRLPRHDTDQYVDRIVTEKGEILPHETQRACKEGNLSKQSPALCEADS